MNRNEHIESYTNPALKGDLKLRLASLPKTNSGTLNASDHIRTLMAKDANFQQLPVVIVAQLGTIADLLDSYRFVAGRLLADNPEMISRLQAFAPAHLDAIRGDAA